MIPLRLFLECADAARADYLVTGNQRHFSEVLEENQGDQLPRVHQHRDYNAGGLTPPI